MSKVKFSVVIPTRQRADTLRHALKSCLDQSFDDYEIIVSDNASSPATRAVIDEAASPRVRYVRSPEPLAMASNWDFALSHARGEYVIVIGDDDGLLPHALAELDSLTLMHQPRAIHWEPAYYTWPSIGLPGQGDYLRVPIGRTSREIVAAETIRGVIGFRQPYTALPMLYHGAIRRDVLEELKQKTQRIVPHRLPDIYSGFAIAAIVERYLDLEVPMSVCGYSAASTSTASLFLRGRSSVEAEFRTLNQSEGLMIDPRVPDLPVFPHVPVADAFLAAQKLLFSGAIAELNRKQLVAGCVANLRAENEAEWRAGLTAIRESLHDDAATQASFDGGLAKTRYRRPAPPRLRADRLGPIEKQLHLDASEFGVTNVAEAVSLCARVLHYEPGDIQYLTNTTDAAAPNWEWKFTCVEQQQEIARLLATCEERAKVIQELDGAVEAYRSRLVFLESWRGIGRHVSAKFWGLFKLGRPTARSN